MATVTTQDIEAFERDGAVLLPGLLADRVEASPEVPASNGTVMIEFDDPKEMEAPFAALGEGGKVTMALHDAFWGARFGMVTDALGVAWMFHCALEKC